MTLYRSAKRAFAREVSNVLGVRRSAAISTLDKIDLENVARFGLSRRRFPFSMGQAYDELARAQGQTPIPSVRGTLRTIGAGVFHGNATVVPGAFSALRSLRDKGFVLAL